MTLLREMRLLALLLGVTLLIPLAAHAQAPVVPPQEPGPDGGLVHVVQFGDTLDGILNAYINLGVTMESLLELNGWRFRPQFIYPDDQIIILPPGSVEPGDGLPVPEGAAAPPQPTPVPESDESQTQPESNPQADAAPPPQAVVLTADEISAMSALEPVAPFVRVLGDVPESQPEPAAQESPAAQLPTALTPIEATPTDTIEEVEPTVTEAIEAVESTATPILEATPADEVAAAPEIDFAPDDASMPDFTVSLGQVCATFFDDINQNGRRDADEAALPGGIILLEEGASATADDSGVGCLVDLGVGSLTVQAAAPDGYGITGPDALRVQVVPGQTTTIDFGASEGYEPPEAPPAVEEALSAPVPESFRTTSEAAPAESDESPLDQLFDVSGLIALAAGLLVFSGGMLLALWLRLVRV